MSKDSSRTSILCENDAVAVDLQPYGGTVGAGEAANGSLNDFNAGEGSVDTGRSDVATGGSSSMPGYLPWEEDLEMMSCFYDKKVHHTTWGLSPYIK